MTVNQYAQSLIVWITRILSCVSSLNVVQSHVLVVLVCVGVFSVYLQAFDSVKLSRHQKTPEFTTYFGTVHYLKISWSSQYDKSSEVKCKKMYKTVP